MKINFIINNEVYFMIIINMAKGNAYIKMEIFMKVYFLN
jgi:hypothetical protein